MPCVAWQANTQEKLETLPDATNIIEASFEDTGLRQQWGVTLNTSVILVDPAGSQKLTVNPRLSVLTDFFAQF